MLEGDPGKLFMLVGVGGTYPRRDGRVHPRRGLGESTKFDPRLVGGGSVIGVRPHCELF